jgi:hypothetical protein
MMEMFPAGFAARFEAGMREAREQVVSLAGQDAPAPRSGEKAPRPAGDGRDQY